MSAPNLIFILADDLGYADLGCYGGRAPVSPNLDRMAAQGLRFTQGYSNSPVCSPTRFGLITGRYHYRIRAALEEPMAGRFRGDPNMGLPPSHPTLPSLLKKVGYHTALIGKWHLGYEPHFGPLLSGYDEHFGPMGGGVDYFTHKDRRQAHDLFENGEPVYHDKYLTDLLSDRACDYVTRRASRDQPFLLSLHYTAPHWPWETREDKDLAQTLTGRIEHNEGGSIHVYRRMIHHMDEGIGRLLATLEKNGQAENTMVVFSSDNGGERFSDNWPLVGGKMDLTEGGIRVPYIVRWPAQVRAATVSAQPVITMDWTRTFVEAGGGEADADYPFDGESLLPILRDPTLRPPRKLFWRMKWRQQRAMREGQWKYLAIGENEYLFDLSADERERANQAKRDPQRLAAMRDAYQQWQQPMMPIPDDARSELVYWDTDMPFAAKRPS